MCGWSFLTITITITTNETFLRNKTQGKKTSNNTYALHPNYKVTTYEETMKSLIWSVNITLLRPKWTCVFNLWHQYNYFCLKDFSVSAWSIIVISQSQIPSWPFCRKCSWNCFWLRASFDSFCLSENYDMCFYSYWL